MSRVLEHALIGPDSLSVACSAKRVKRCVPKNCCMPLCPGHGLEGQRHFKLVFAYRWNVNDKWAELFILVETNVFYNKVETFQIAIKYFTSPSF